MPALRSAPAARAQAVQPGGPALARAGSAAGVHSNPERGRALDAAGRASRRTPITRPTPEAASPSPAARPPRCGSARPTGCSTGSRGRVRCPRLHFVNVQGTATAADRLRTAVRGAVSSGLATLAGAARAEAAAAQPDDREPREDWGADACPPRSAPELGEVKAAFVHHTVNANDYTAEEAPDVVLAICRFHRNSNGWNDIGYNFLVDKFGTIYEGRAGGIDQAGDRAPRPRATTPRAPGSPTSARTRACAQTPEALDAIARLIRWKLPLHGSPTAGLGDAHEQRRLEQPLPGREPRARAQGGRPPRHGRHRVPRRRPLRPAPAPAPHGGPGAGGRGGDHHDAGPDPRARPVRERDPGVRARARPCRGAAGRRAGGGAEAKRWSLGDRRGRRHRRGRSLLDAATAPAERAGPGPLPGRRRAAPSNSVQRTAGRARPARDPAPAAAGARWPRRGDRRAGGTPQAHPLARGAAPARGPLDAGRACAPVRGRGGGFETSFVPGEPGVWRFYVVAKTDEKTLRGASERYEVAIGR